MSDAATTLVAWREACIALAGTRAAEEARLLWGVAAPTPIPFDYRWEHVKQVVEVALRLGEEIGADAEVIEAAAWLHDIRKLEKQHALVGAAEAGPFLRTIDFPPDKIAAVVDAIAQHEGFYRPEGAESIEPVEAAVLWDADKLTKLGVGAILASMASPYVKGETLQRRFDFANSFAREVLSRTVTSMNTPPARALAQARYTAMIAFLDGWQDELSGKA